LGIFRDLARQFSDAVLLLSIVSPLLEASEGAFTIHGSGYIYALKNAPSKMDQVAGLALK
jgi:hypothetical protein